VRLDLITWLAHGRSALHTADVSVRGPAATLGVVCILVGCGHNDSDPKYGSPQAIAAAIGRRQLLGPTNIPAYRQETCTYKGHRVEITWLPKDGESTDFMYASRGDGFVLNSRWLVKCWQGPDCIAIQRKVGGKSYTSTGHA
jgi:hypothetical protein